MSLAPAGAYSPQNFLTRPHSGAFNHRRARLLGGFHILPVRLSQEVENGQTLYIDSQAANVM
jgi:hypothetical protein